MPTPGTRIGPYEIVGRIGAGGMGEVYRAHDTRLRRDVAIKSLPDTFAHDPDLLARFEREARTLAALNHPHVAQIYGIEDAVLAGSDRRPLLVMELVDGQDLAARTTRGALPLGEALRIAGQIADALDAAHEAGIIHRDLKPSNIRLRGDGTVKVLDFGIAHRRLEPGSSEDAPTVSAAVTAPGVITGTVAYMSPEQVRGLPATRRTDVWAFGCVLYEMLTGARAFGGGTHADVVAAVLNAEPDFSRLPSETPADVRRVLRRCLAKDPGERLRDMADIRLAIADARAADPGAATALSAGSAGWWRLAALALLVLALVGAAVAWSGLGRTPPAQPVVRFTLSPNESDGPRRWGVAVSRDGARVAHVSANSLVVKSRDRLDQRVLQGLGTFIGRPVFSPDGAWIAYTDAPLLKKVSVGGGTPVTIGESGPGAGVDWTDDGIVVANVRGLFRIPAEGAPAVEIPLSLRENEQATAPRLLPAGRGVVYTVLPTRTILVPGAARLADARLEVVDLGTGTRRELIRGGSYARYVSTGHLIYVSGETLHAIRFDLADLTVKGQAIQLLTEPVSEFDVAEDGTLVYASSARTTGVSAVWVDRQDTSEEPLGVPARAYAYPRLSPDGTRVAFDVVGVPDRDIWMWDIQRKSLERFTLDPAGNPIVEWSRDGRHVAFGSDRHGPTNLFMQAADGSGQPERLLTSDRIQMPLTFAPDGRLLFSEEVPGHGRDIHALALDGSKRVTPLVATPANELNAHISRDGRWLAYDSNESGQFEVYVRPYPNVDSGRWKISVDGGKQPLWSPVADELLYRDFSGAVMVVPVTTNPSFAAGRALKVLDGAGYSGGGPQGGGRTYDISLDGKRLLMLKAGQTTAPSRIVIVVNWFEELKRLTYGQ